MDIFISKKIKRLTGRELGPALLMVLPLLLLSIALPLHGQPGSASDTTQAGEHYASARSLIKDAEYERANKLLIQAAESFRSAEQWTRTAEAYNLLSSNFRILSRLDSAAYYASQSIELFEDESISAPGVQARAYNNLALIETDNSNFQQAITLFERALELAENESVPVQTQATVLGNFGSLYDEQGNFNKALDYYSQAIALLTGDESKVEEHREQLARLYNYIGITYRKKGEFDKALRFYERELQINLDLYGEGHPSVARVYTNMGGIYYYRGDFGQAIIYFKRAAESTELVFGQVHPRVGLLYNNIGAVYYEQGNFEQAIDYFKRSAEIKRQTQGENHPDLALTYNNIGSIYTEMEEYETAIDYLQRSLEIRKATLGEDHPVLSNNYNSLGMLYLNTGDNERAIQYFQQSLEITLRSRGSKHPYAAEARTNLARAYRSEGQLSQAMTYLQTAEQELTLSAKDRKGRPDSNINMPYRHPTAAVDVLHEKGKTLYLQYENSGNFSYLQSGMETYSHLSGLLDVIQLSFLNEESKLLMGAESHRIYEDALKTAFALFQETDDEDYLDDMFFFAEKSKARVILELLNNKKAQTFAGIPDSLVAYETELREDLSSLQQTLSSEESAGELEQKNREMLQDSLFRLNSKLNAHLDYLKKAYPKYHAFKYQSEVLSLDELRSQYFAGKDGAILEYFYGAENSWAMVIKPDEVEAVQLPHLDDLSSRIVSFNGAISQKKDSSYLQMAHQLYQALIEPAEPYLENENVLLVPDGAMNLVPFDALLSRPVEDPGSFRNLPYLLNTYRFSYTPSVSLSSYLDLEGERNYPEKFIAFAPVFSETTRGVAQPTSNRKGWEALPSTKYEVEEIAGYLNQNRGIWASLTGGASSEVVTGHDATEASFKKGSLSRYRYLHLATHAFTSDSESQRSGIAFFPGGSGEENGILYAEEIYGLDLRNELVVLSACETGTGEVRAGEGIIGLSRAFQYAGAQSLLVSLWNVEDRSTAQLMIAFYEQLQAGNSAAAALKTAKQSLLTSGTYSHPRYWAPFVFIGN